MPVFLDAPKNVSSTNRVRRLSQSTEGVSSSCALPLDSQSTKTLSLPADYLQADMVYEFTVTVTSASSGNCTRDRSTTESRVITTQSEPLPEMQVEVCKDAICKTQVDLVGGVATVNADRASPNLYVKLGVGSKCTTDVNVIWATSLERVHLATKDLLEQHTLNSVGYEMLKISFNYIYPLAAEYTFSMTAKCSARGSSSASVGLGIVMNYGPSGGKMEVRLAFVGLNPWLEFPSWTHLPDP